MLSPVRYRGPDHPTPEHWQPVPGGHHLHGQEPTIVCSHQTQSCSINRIQGHNMSGTQW